MYYVYVCERERERWGINEGRHMCVSVCVVCECVGARVYVYVGARVYECRCMGVCVSVCMRVCVLSASVYVCERYCKAC